ncbi:MAG: glycosyl transferase family 90 [Rickettsiales bacterium]
MKIKLILILLIILLGNCLKASDHLKIIDAEHFLIENPSIERKKIVNFITHQFDSRREAGVTQAQIDKLWNNKQAREAFSISRFQIINQKIYADSSDVTHPYFTAFFHYFQKFVKKYKVNDVDFIIYTRDEIPLSNGLEKLTLNVPAFMNSKNTLSEYEKDMLLLPDAFMLHPSWSKLINRITIANSKIEYSWENKIDKIFWRGGTSGLSKGAYNIGNFDKLPRLSLVILSKLYPDLIDAQFTYYMKSAFDSKGQSLRKLLDILLEEKLHKVKEEDHLKYKYLISIDGNTCPWVRIPWIMLSNSALLKQETSNMQWFYPAMEPYVHYIPVNARLTDIFSQLEWIKTHDKELHKISKNATHFVQNNLAAEDIDAHMAIILNEYSKLQKDAKIIPTLPAEEDAISMPALLKSLTIWIFNYAKSWIESWI